MPTLHLMLDAQDREWEQPKRSGVSYATLHLENFSFNDQEVLDYAQAAALMLLGAVQGAETSGMKDGDEGVK